MEKIIDELLYDQYNNSVQTVSMALLQGLMANWYIAYMIAWSCCGDMFEQGCNGPQ